MTDAGRPTDLRSLNLALYRDQIIPANAAIDALLLDMMQERGGRRIAYIPSGPEPGRRFFNERRHYYAQYGLDLADFIDLGGSAAAADIDALFASDAIHLTGGHTGSFLRRLERAGMIEPLRRWAQDGGILIGTSAGAILMTPTIAVDALFAKGRPEDVEEGEALRLLPFEFFPHLDTDPDFLPGLLRYSATTSRPIAACNDGDGIVVTRGEIHCVGKPAWMLEGRLREASDLHLGALSIASS